MLSHNEQRGGVCVCVCVFVFADNLGSPELHDCKNRKNDTQAMVYFIGQ